MRAATAAVGGDTAGLDDAIERWWAPTRAQGLPPRQASGSSTGSRFGDFHPWPSAAAGAWVILARHGYPGSPGR
jgi:hypothetical protein